MNSSSQPMPIGKEITYAVLLVSPLFLALIAVTQTKLLPFMLFGWLLSIIQSLFVCWIFWRTLMQLPRSSRRQFQIYVGIEALISLSLIVCAAQIFQYGSDHAAASKEATSTLRKENPNFAAFFDDLEACKSDANVPKESKNTVVDCESQAIDLAEKRGQKRDALAAVQRRVEMTQQLAHVPFPLSLWDFGAP